jgi:Fe-S cluster assembly iron-binding protein IscA
MVNVTQRAKVKLKELLDSESDDRAVGLRLGKTGSGALGLFPDRGRPDDQVVEHEGAAVLLVGQDIAATVDNRTIDCDDSGPEARLTVT